MTARAIDARSDETAQQAQSEGRERGATGTRQHEGKSMTNTHPEPLERVEQVDRDLRSAIWRKMADALGQRPADPDTVDREVEVMLARHRRTSTPIPGEGMREASKECQAPGCDNFTDQGICDECDLWVDQEVAKLKADGSAEALREVRSWIASITGTDLNEIVADGGVTAGMVVEQEAREQLRRIDRALFTITTETATQPPVMRNASTGEVERAREAAYKAAVELRYRGFPEGEKLQERLAARHADYMAGEYDSGEAFRAALYALSPADTADEQVKTGGGEDRDRLIACLHAAGGLHNPDANAPHVADAILRNFTLSNPQPVDAAERVRAAIDARPNIGAGQEPSIRQIVRGYFGAHFAPDDADDLTSRYLDAITTEAPTPKLGEEGE